MGRGDGRDYGRGSIGRRGSRVERNQSAIDMADATFVPSTIEQCFSMESRLTISKTPSRLFVVWCTFFNVAVVTDATWVVLKGEWKG